MSELYSIGTSALSTAYSQLRTAGNNIANVSTPGYSRETVTQSAEVGVFQGSNFFGQGVQVDQVARNYNQFLTAQANQYTAASAAADQQAQDLSQINSLFSTQGAGVSTAVSNFFASAQTLSQTPADPAARQALLSSGQALAQSVNAVGTSLQDMQSTSQQALTLQVGTVNGLSTQIASLNQQIMLAQGNGAAPNQLLDQRDSLVRTLNQSISVTEVPQSDGSSTLFLGNGQPLVMGSTASTLKTQQDPINAQNLEVGVTQANGTLIPIPVNEVGGGKIGAMLQFEQVDVPSIQNQIGRLAVVVSDQINTQQALGQDLNGNAGAAFFSTPSTSVIAASTNTGTGTVSAAISSSSLLQPSDYRIDVVGGNYVVTRSSDGNKTTSATMPISVDGLTLSVSGTPANGDIYTVEPVRAGSLNMSVALTQTSEIAAATPVIATPGANNGGSLAVSDLSVAGLPLNANLTPLGSVPLPANWSLTASGTPSAGDTLSVAANVGGTGDNTNLIKMAQLQSQNVVGQTLVNAQLVGGGTIAEGYGAIVASVGGLAQAANTTQTAQGTALQSSLSAEASVAGVNLDEEATNLIEYQQQYQAAAKIITTANTVFDTILNLSST